MLVKKSLLLCVSVSPFCICRIFIGTVLETKVNRGGTICCSDGTIYIAIGAHDTIFSMRFDMVGYSIENGTL